MAFTHLQFDDQKPLGRLLRRWLNGLESSLDDGADVLALFPTLIDGDGSQDAHYTEVVNKLGFPDTATAHGAWNEIQSAYSKISGDASVASVNAAINQVIAKLR